MPKVAYVNGRYEPITQAGVSIEDRGFQFADGVYEVIAVLRGVQLDGAAHHRRLQRSLGALEIAAPVAPHVLPLLIAEVLKRNHVREGLVYLQITRGVAPRDHPFPPAGTAPSLIISAKPYDFNARAALAQHGVAAISLPDIRWQRCDIKSISLLPNVLAKQAAKVAGAAEAVFVNSAGEVTEGGSTNMWMVDKKGALITRPLGQDILPGIARETLRRAAQKARLKVIERGFSLAEMKAAPEAFFTSTTSPCMPIIRLDGARMGAGSVGPVCTELLDHVWQEIRRQTGFTRS